MKKILYIATIGFTLLTSSCNDFLDRQVPQGIVTGDQIASPEYVDNLVISAYAIWATGDDINSSFSLWNYDVRSDDCYKGGSGTEDGGVFNALEISKGINTTDWNINDIWKRLYQCITRANTALQSLDLMDEKTYPLKNQRIAEMRFLRGHAHFMLKEIFEQPTAISKAITGRIQEGRVVLSDLTMTDREIRDIGRICIVACGSSYHVGMVGKYNLERMLRRSVEVCLASEFRYSDPIIGPGDLVIVISQSGETLDSMAALREAKKRGARILSIVNVVGSSIARESDDVLYTWAGPEIAVATTKAYSTQMVVLNLLGLYFGDIMGTIDLETYTAMVQGIQALPHQMEEILSDTGYIQAAARELAGHDQVFFIGRNLDYALSLEGSLKLKEISYIHSEAYASGELKHGTISLIEEGTPVIAAATYMPLFDKAMSNVVEVQARGAQVLALTTESHAGEMGKRVPMLMTIPDTEEMLLPQLGVVPLQLLAYYIALERGCDIDKPRNLAKSVTVE